jgi:cation diffusion facilitator CzcD-associated flavoprotein CzcO
LEKHAELHTMERTPLDFDVIIIGAGLSGIGAAYHVQTGAPGLRYTVLEGRSSMGGTWDLFRYPGIRSDSDMYTLGFSFNPWTEGEAIADGPAILRYIHSTAEQFGIHRHIRFDHRVVQADWSDADACWTLTLRAHPNVPKEVLRCRFVIACCGYYDYQQGHAPEFTGSADFQGRIVHPQFWPQDLDWSGKNVVVIGSGATAATLVPELARRAAHVSMLQRSPTYYLDLPRTDTVATFLHCVLPRHWAYNLVRWKNILLSWGFYQASRKWPRLVADRLRKAVRRALGERYRDADFTPRYKPWDQRLCIVPGGDLFSAIRAGKVEVVTDTIDRFVAEGIRTTSGRVLPADLIITATGLKVQLLGGIKATINGREVHTGQLHCYRGVMFGGVPNFAVAIGYTNASWTLKCDLNCAYVARLLRHMQRKGHRIVVPHYDPARHGSEPLLDFDANYIKRAADILPKQGSRTPWKVYQNYLRDMLMLKHGRVADGHLRFS